MKLLTLSTDAMVYKKITLLGTSPESFEDAVDSAALRATDTLENVNWIEVEGLSVEIASADEHTYQAEVEVSFEVEE
jgi:flavin-binding protein dodecin